MRPVWGGDGRRWGWWRRGGSRRTGRRRRRRLASCPGPGRLQRTAAGLENAQTGEIATDWVSGAWIWTGLGRGRLDLLPFWFGVGGVVVGGEGRGHGDGMGEAGRQADLVGEEEEEQQQQKQPEQQQ